MAKKYGGAEPMEVVADDESDQNSSNSSIDSELADRLRTPLFHHWNNVKCSVSEQHLYQQVAIDKKPLYTQINEIMYSRSTKNEYILRKKNRISIPDPDRIRINKKIEFPDPDRIRITKNIELPDPDRIRISNRIEFAAPCTR